MITPQKIHELAIKGQTSDVNIAREYLQHLFLSYFYQRPGSDKFLFKGGTALRIVFGSPRYSEDLDFSIPRMDAVEIEDFLADTFARLEAEGIATNMDLTDAETTSGGYIANIDLNILGFETGIKSNLQIKKDEARLESEPQIIENALFIPAYSITALSRKLIVKEKVQALIYRFKPRDFFDLYFMNRKDGLKEFVPHDEESRKGILAALDKVDERGLESDLKPFMPTNYQPIIKTLRSSLYDAFKI